MVRIDSLPYSNFQMQGAARRDWLRQHSAEHLQQCATMVRYALKYRAPATARSIVVLGAGACTEVPLQELTRAADEVILVDLDLTAMLQARDELSSQAARKRIHPVQCDISGNVSDGLQTLMKRYDWKDLAQQGATALFDAAARCLEKCIIPDPPKLPELETGIAGLVISSLVLSQLFSYPLLDVLDRVQSVAPALVGEQERHRRYQDAAQNFRIRVIAAHLHLLRDLLDTGGNAVLLSDVRGFVFNVHGTNHDTTHRRSIPLVPRTFSELVHDSFTVVEESRWEWLTDLPTNERPGRGYEVAGYILQPS